MATPGAARGTATSRPWVRSTRGSPSAPLESVRKASSSLLFAPAPSGLYLEGDGAFEFQRTVSRLMEMQSPEYLALDHIA